MTNATEHTPSTPVCPDCGYVAQAHGDYTPPAVDLDEDLARHEVTHGHGRYAPACLNCDAPLPADADPEYLVCDECHNDDTPEG